MHIHVKCIWCTVHYLRNKTEDYVTVTAVRVSYIAQTMGSNFMCVCVCVCVCVCFSIVLCKHTPCRAHFEALRDWTELKMIKQRAGWAEEWLLGALAKLRKATTGFVISARTSVHIEHLGSHWTDFHENSIFWGFFENPSRKIHVSLKSDKNNRYFTWRSIHIFIIPRSVLLRMRNVSDRIVEKIKTHILGSAIASPPPENCAFIR